MKYIHPCIFKIFLVVSAPLFVSRSLAQSNSRGSVKLDYGKIYGWALQANIKPALALLPVDSSKLITQKDKEFIKNFEDRFKYEKDRSDYLEERKSPIDSLLRFFSQYWRVSLENETQNYDSNIVRKLSIFLSEKYDLDAFHNELPVDTLDRYLTKYIRSKSLYTTGFGRTGKLYDLLVWKKEKDTVYNFRIGNEKITAPVVFMDDFVTLGWEQYATLGKNYPGGWTTKDAIFCVRKAYDVKSESFRVDLLAHEGRHFADAALFPRLGAADLEYRAKLVELSLLKESIYKTLEFFINEADHSTYQNAHPFADYCLIRDLSAVLFHVAFEKDMNKWRTVSCSRINTAAQRLLIQNTNELKHLGSKNVKQHIR